MAKLNYIIPLLLLLFILSGCKQGTSGEEEINKLIERQAELKKTQEKSLDEMQQLRDSLELERTALMGERNLKDQRIKQLAENQQLLADRLKQEEQAEVSSEKEELQKNINLYEDSIDQLKTELSRLDTKLDSIETTIELYQIQEKQADKMLESGINEVDQQISSLEKQKRQELKKIDLLEKRHQIASKKIEAYMLERKMYVEERDGLLRIQATAEQLAPFRRRISEMDSIISRQEEQKQAILQELNEAKQWISEVDSMMSDMQVKIKDEYDRNQIIESFITAQKQRLGKDLEKLKRIRMDLIGEQEMIIQDMASTEEKINSLNKRLELIRNREMSDILEQQAVMERSEANLAEEEIQLLEEASVENRQRLAMTSDTSLKALQSLDTLGKELDSLSDLIRKEKSAIANARKALAEKRAEAAQQRAKFGRTAGILVLVIIIGGIGLLTFLYYLGKRARKEKL